MRHPLQIALIGFAVLLAVLLSHVQRQVALVIGNNTYRNVAPPTAPGLGSGPLVGNPILQLSQNKPTPPAPPADLLVEDVPLPGNVSVSNPQNVPENFKRFSGAWVGAWGGQLHHILIVESIKADGTANVVYAIGDNPAANVRRQWQRLDATIVGNTLRAERFDSFATYELTGNGHLDAAFERYLRSHATMSRIELADLTRPGATIWQNKPTPPSSAADLLVENVPLPGNVGVSNPQNVPENFKRFSGAWVGAWVGAWGGQLHHILIVESIKADGTANIVYATGDNAVVRRLWARLNGTIVGNMLRAGSVTYELTGNGQLDATYDSNGRAHATMSRIELADLTRPGATIWQNKPTPPSSAADLLVENVPLPGNVSVSNPQNVPENFKRFSGAWVGAWGGQLHHILIVESIKADGTANVVYAIGDNEVARRQWQRGDATIVGNALRVGFATYESIVGDTLRVGFATYELTGNGQLDATYDDSNGRAHATMSRIELADLTRPGATISQDTAMPVVGFLNHHSPNPNAVGLAAFRQGLGAAGFVEGRNVAIEYRWANNQPRLLAPLAAELVKRKVAVIVALDSAPAIFAAKNATSTIPVVFSEAGDPITGGLVASLNRPRDNVTGVTSLSSELAGKRLDLLREMAPLPTTIAYLTDPRIFHSAAQTKDILAAARALGRQALILEARSPSDIDAAFATLVKRGAGALVVSPHLLFGTYSHKIVELAARHKVPAIYPHRLFADAGGLMSYSADVTALWRLIGSLYVAQILKGAKPVDLPVQQPTKFELVINLKTAKALGLTVPPRLFALADEVIE